MGCHNFLKLGDPLFRFWPVNNKCSFFIYSEKALSGYSCCYWPYAIDILIWTKVELSKSFNKENRPLFAKIYQKIIKFAWLYSKWSFIVGFGKEIYRLSTCTCTSTLERDLPVGKWVEAAEEGGHKRLDRLWRQAEIWEKIVIPLTAKWVGWEQI